MKELLSAATKTLINATSCTMISRWLHEIVGIVMSEKPSERSDVLQEVLNVLAAATLKKLNEYRAQPDRNPWYVATGSEADFMYIVNEIGSSDNNEDDVKIKLAKMDYLASKLEQANDDCVHNVDHAREIFEYCEHEFNCFSKSQYYDLTVLAFPNIDIDCVAKCPVLDESTFVMVVNEKNSAFGLVETFAYETAALLIASDGVSDEDVALLSETTSPGAADLSDDERYWEFLLSIKHGLAHNGPYGSKIADLSDYDRYADQWSEYIKNRF